MDILWRGPVWGQSGFEVITRGMLIALDKLGVNIQLDDKREWNLHKTKLDNEDAARLIRMMKQRVPVDSILISQQVPSQVEGWKPRLSICYTLFETDKCPTPWIPNLNNIDETWVFSEFNRSHWEEGGVNNVKVLPFGVDTKLFNPEVEPIELPTEKKFIFFANGDYVERKGFADLLEAYVKEFTPEDDVCLVIKTHFAGFIRHFKDQVFYKLKECAHRFCPDNRPEILFFGDNIPATEMPRFYTACDCYILCSRGEGIGLPFAEAMACGRPCITTNWGGQMDFVTEENGFLVDSEVRLIDDQEYILKCINALGHSWALPNIQTMRNAMRLAYEFPNITKERGKKARADIEERSWHKAALWILNRLFELEKK